jgi:hypothetical protein
MAVCVKPFHLTFNRALWLVEFIEMYRLQGASHFIFYNHTIGPDIEAVLLHYERQGLVTLLQWNMPLKSQKEIRTEAMFTAMEDCNLRSVNRFDLLAIVDLDEYIMPVSADNLTTLLDTKMKLRPELGAFVFRNVFHYMYWENVTGLIEENWPKTK